MGGYLSQLDAAFRSIHFHTCLFCYLSLLAHNPHPFLIVLINNKISFHQQLYIQIVVQLMNSNNQDEQENKKFQFLSSVHSKHLNCKVCQKLMLLPIRLHKCGHTFCSTCVEKKSVKQCPVCLQKISAKQKDILASRLIGQLSVRCTNGGCPWKGAYEEFLNFHAQGCRLKQGGIEGWLKQLQNTISQNITQNGGNSLYKDQSEKREAHSEKNSVESKNNSYSKEKALNKNHRQTKQQQQIMKDLLPMKRQQLEQAFAPEQEIDPIDIDQNLSKRMKKINE